MNQKIEVEFIDGKNAPHLFVPFSKECARFLVETLLGNPFALGERASTDQIKLVFSAPALIAEDELELKTVSMYVPRHAFRRYLAENGYARDALNIAERDYSAPPPF